MNTSCSQLRLAPEFILGALLTISPNPSCAIFNGKHWQLIIVSLHIKCLVPTQNVT